MTQAIKDTISIGDISATGGEERISHKRLACALGMSADWKLRQLIDRNIVEFRRYGAVSTATVETSAKGGRPGKIYWLNEGQAVLAAVRSEAPRAPDVRFQVIAAFMEYRRQRLVPVVSHVREHERRPSTRMDKALSLARSADRLESIVARLSPAQIGLVIDGEHVSVDLHDYRVHGDRAVVLTYDGQLKISEVEHMPGNIGMAAQRHGSLPPEPWRYGGVSRATCIILGRVQPGGHTTSVIDDARGPGRPPIYRDEILRLTKEGVSKREIVMRLGCSPYTVQAWRRTLPSAR